MKNMPTIKFELELQYWLDYFTNQVGRQKVTIIGKEQTRSKPDANNSEQTNTRV